MDSLPNVKKLRKKLVANLANEKLKRLLSKIIDELVKSNTFLGLINLPSLSKTTIKCSEFSLIIRTKKTDFAIFATKDSVYTFDISCLLASKSPP